MTDPLAAPPQDFNDSPEAGGLDLIPASSGGLSAAHAELIRASAVSPEVAAERGYRSLDAEEAAAELPALGFAEYQARSSGLLVPLWDVYGQNGSYQFRPDAPRISKDGKPVKYESPQGARNMLDVPPRMRPHLGAPNVTVIFTEGARKADALASLGYCAVDFSGVWNWLSDGKPLGDFEALGRGFDAILMFDSDARSNSNVRLGLERLGTFLRSRGAKVRVALPPDGPDGSKQGVDDYLAAGGDFNVLFGLPENLGGADDELFDTWQPVNLSMLGERSPTLPDLAPHLPIFYPGKRHVVSGLPESLKTMLVYAGLLSALRNGKRVGVLNFEMDEFDARDMFRDLGASDEELGAVVFISPERKPKTEDIASVVDRRLDIVAIDAGAGMYELEDADDNKRGEVEKAAKKWIRPLWKASTATVLLDHQAKSRSGGWAIGSERKIGQTDVHLRLDAKVKLVRGGKGTIRFYIEKDRPGYIRREMPDGFEVHVQSHPETNALAFATKALDHHDSDDFRPTGLMEKVSKYVQQHEDKTKNEVCVGCGGKKEYVLKAIDVLKDEGYIDVVPEGKKHIVVHLKPYREMDEVFGGPTSPMSVPEDF